jgi:hypothetical protein
MSAYDRDTVVYFDEYKTYNGFKYHLGFPDDWILDEMEDTGRQCDNCVGINEERNGYAMWRGIILGYCVSCAREYNGTRCSGFNAHAAIYPNQEYESPYNKYLGNIDLENYGDLEANPDDTMENHNLMKDEFEDEYYKVDYPQSEIDAQERACAEYTDSDYENDCALLEKALVGEWTQNLRKYPCFECEYCDDYDDCDDCDDYESSDDEECRKCWKNNCHEEPLWNSAYCRAHEKKTN